MVKRRIGAGVATLALALGGWGCGGGDEPAETPATGIRALQAAFAADDLAALCQRMTPAAREDAGSMGHGVPTTCRRDLRRALEMIEQGGRWGAPPAIARVDANGDRATAILEQESGWQAAVPLVKEDGVWKLDAFFGTGGAEFDVLEKNLRDRPFPDGADGRPVAVANRDGECAELSDARYPHIRGGCKFTVSSRDVPVRMLTPFGDFKFGSCAFDYVVWVDSRGRTWTREWFTDSKTTPGCADLNACYTEDEAFPWKGRLVADGSGGFLHHMDICLRTCVGRYAGVVVMRFARQGRGWRVEPTGRDVTGFKIDGDLRVAKGGLDVRPG